MKCRNKIWLAVACLIAFVGYAQAVPPSMDSLTFDWKYEMDTPPNDLDLDSNGTDDWWDGGAPAVSNGLAIGGVEGEFFRTDYGGSIWRENVTGAAFTIEFSVQVLTTGTEGTVGTLGCYARNPATGGGPYFNVARSGQSLINTQATLDLGTQDNTDGQHVFRIAREEDGSVWAWRDGELLNPNGEAMLGDLAVFNNDILQIGDIWSTGHSGDYELDYLRFTSGAYAPYTNQAKLVSPAYGADMVETTAILEWAAPNEGTPTGYDVYFGTDPNVTNMTKVVSDQLVYQYDPEPDMANDTTYYWRVDALDSTAGTTVEGQVWEFTTIPAVPVVTVNPTGTTVPVGAIAQFSAEGTNTTDYDWYKYVDGINDTFVGSGSTLLLENIQQGDEGYYYCILSNTAGTATSESAYLMTERAVAGWTFEGDALDSVGTNDALIDVPTYVTDGIAGAQSLQVTVDDPNTFAIVPNVDELNQPTSFTVESWFKVNGFGNHQAIVSNRGGTLETGAIAGWVVYILPGGGVGLWANDSGWTQVNSTDPLTANEWHHVVATYDSGDVKVYINGEVAAEATEVSMAVNTYTDLYIGAGNNDATAPAFYLDGVIDEVNFWSYAKTNYEVAHMYTGVAGGTICVEPVEFDLNGDCTVDLSDLAQLSSSWMDCNLVPSCLE
ncbi:hypothetical protein STSP2_01341 [Anaerohalosphaera lusitana]|uniref:Ig-like domain-containing protein n=1 Tax=Anaerohalosphaera lusitana TaxID=1936003 RepID=A0A1U9NKZ7_9BACT|nr:LamG-like jellyroll fold domain-containing protein [Anaerohalosphaera lusitana]AQT68186.1 hypothetical protein STSP2_01341 [Anaerohalosphaera lusitana]